ncbi:MAG: DUF4440 domain-containing protein [Gemmatimonadota bacterium]
MTTRARAGLLLAALQFTACEVSRTPRPEVVDADSAAREDIRAALNRYQEALLSADARAAASFFASDGRLMQADAPDLVGARQVNDSLSAFFADARITSISLDRSSIDIGPAGTAHEIGTFIQSVRAGDQAEQTVRGRYAIRWRVGPESSWRINVFLSSLYPVDSAAADTAAAADTDSGG